jgi:hypothetical protein
MPQGTHLLEHLGDPAPGIDDEGRAIDSHVLLAEHAFLRPDAVRLHDLVIGVGEERERQVVLGLERGVLLHGVGADPKDHCIESLEPREGVSKRARLDGSARGVVLGIEVQNHRAPLEILQ